jgi:hypothetical protein
LKNKSFVALKVRPGDGIYPNRISAISNTTILPPQNQCFYYRKLVRIIIGEGSELDRKKPAISTPSCRSRPMLSFQPQNVVRISVGNGWEGVGNSGIRTKLFRQEMQSKKY